MPFPALLQSAELAAGALICTVEGPSLEQGSGPLLGSPQADSESLSSRTSRKVTADPPKETDSLVQDEQRLFLTRTFYCLDFLSSK